jgi:hypothetical protein
MKKLYRGPYIDAFCQVWFHLVQLFQRSRLKYEKLTPFRQQIWPPRAIFVSDWLMLEKSSPLKLLGQMEPNLAGSIYVRSSIKLLHLVPFRQQTWPLLLKMFGSSCFRSRLKYEKLTDGRCMPSDGNTSHDPLGQVS